MKNWLIGEVPDSGKDWKQEEKRATWMKCMASPTWWTWVWATPVVGDGQGSLALCSSWIHKELDMTEWLKWWTYQRILRYQVILVENPGLAMSPCEVVNPVLLQTPKGSLPFPSCLETLDHWTNHERHFHKILWPILRKSCVLMGVVLS